MSKEKLKALEETGAYVFHGSPNGAIESLEPRQSTHIPDLKKPDQFILDGKAAVSATPYVEFAIFRALVNSTNIPIEHTSGFGITDGVKGFRVSTQEAFDLIKGKKGYVYVFDRVNFRPYDRDGGTEKLESMEWRSYESVKPVEIIEVSEDDLPDKDHILIGQEWD